MDRQNFALIRRWLVICCGVVLVLLVAITAWPHIGWEWIGGHAEATVGGPLEGAQAGQLRNDNSLHMAMLWVPVGRFKMGSPPSEKGRYPNEEQVDATIAHGFWLGRYEVTQSQWRTLMGSSPWYWREETKSGADYPATFVSWDDATEFCNALTTHERDSGRLPPGWEYNLPTEAQWEYACRAGSTTRYSFGDDDSKLTRYAWYDADTRARTSHMRTGLARRSPTDGGSTTCMGMCWNGVAMSKPGSRQPTSSVASPRRMGNLK